MTLVEFFQLWFKIMTMDELSIQRMIALAATIVLTSILTSKTNIKVIIITIIISFALIILGTVVFVSGAIAGWGLLTIAIPFFTYFAPTVILTHIALYFHQKFKNK